MLLLLLALLTGCGEPAPAAKDCGDDAPAVETCAPGDEDCDGLADDADPSLDRASATAGYDDGDGDGYGDPATARLACVVATTVGGDCDDADPAVNPGAAETCTPGDEDCDGLADDEDPGRVGEVPGFADLDDDGYGDGQNPILGCDPLEDASDCDDTDRSVHPGAEEQCNLRDDDCSGAPDPQEIDADGDGVCDGILTRTLHGYFRLATDNLGHGGILVTDANPPAASTVTADDGTWTLTVANADYVHLLVSCDDCLLTEAWIDPWEAEGSTEGYTLAVGSEAELSGLYGLLGETYDPSLGTVFVDAMDRDLNDIAGAPITLGPDYASAWYSVGATDVVEGTLSSGDWMDTVFVGVAPGPLTLTVVDPDGGPCVGPADAEVVPGEVIQVSYYCDWVPPSGG